MAKHPLMIVESITKSKTISKLLGSGITVKASIGHICDLPNGKDLGVDLAHDFKPNYVLTPQGQHVIRELRAEAKKADEIYLATDPDREGEAIAWHLQNYLWMTMCQNMKGSTISSANKKSSSSATSARRTAY